LRCRGIFSYCISRNMVQAGEKN